MVLSPPIVPAIRLEEIQHTLSKPTPANIPVVFDIVCYYNLPRI
jgi:hypothetical protein